MRDASPSRAQVVTQLLAEVESLSVAERGTHLERACGEDRDLRAVVEFLLQNKSKLAQDADAEGADAADRLTEAEWEPVGIGRHIGRYKILESLGEGGFGAVYAAEQEEPIRRLVALKIVKPGMDSRQVVARFEAERQALAMMNHPHIAKVLDAGTTARGLPYFAMELVRGIPITAYCEDHRVAVRERLELFASVCDAVQHAHQKGIIHRDIKPSNILATVQEGKPEPKVIDFGIAKAMQARLTEKTLYTQQRTLMGTPEYMSPEQAEMSGLDVDTRADIYSLGVLLYELLTGETPFGSELGSRGYGEMQRIIREVEPARPSVRLKTKVLSKAPGAQEVWRREIERGDELDWIAMKCLEKDRTRRYDSAGALGADVRRYLIGEAVLARPATWPYRARKFVLRHRAAVAAAAMIALALIAGIIVANVGMVQARHEQMRALNAQEETARAFELLRELTQESGKLPYVPDRIRDAVSRLDAGWLKDQPEKAAAVRSAIGMKYLDFDPAFAEKQFGEALKLLETGQSVAASTADAYVGLGTLALRKGDFAAADARLTQALAAIEAGNAARDPSFILQMLRRTRMKLGDRESVRRFGRMEVEWQIRVHTHALRQHERNELALAERSRLRASLGQFAESAEDLRQLVAINSKQIPPRILLGYLELYLGNEESHTKRAQELLARISEVDGDDRAQIVRLNVIAPRTIADKQPFLQALHEGGDVDPEMRRLVRALVLYRAGNLLMARDMLLEHFDTGQTRLSEEPIAEMVMAMCQQKIGNAGYVRLWYDQSLRSAATAWPAPGDEVIDAVSNYVAFAILRREAEKVLDVEAK